MRDKFQRTNCFDTGHVSGYSLHSKIVSDSNIQESEVNLLKIVLMLQSRLEQCVAQGFKLKIVVFVVVVVVI